MKYKEVKAVCCRCNKKLQLKDAISYLPSMTKVDGIDLICDKCIEKETADWQIKSASFYFMNTLPFVDVVLASGQVYPGLTFKSVGDCCYADAIDDISPESFKRQLLIEWKKYAKSGVMNELESISFTEDFKNLYFTAKTKGGKEYYDVEFFIDRKGQFQIHNSVVMNETTKQYIIAAWNDYLKNN